MISVNWRTRVITVPRDFMEITRVDPEARVLDLDAFRRALKALEDNELGISYDDTHVHTGPVAIGGLDLGRVVEIINGYTVTFEEGNYRADVLGGNSNLGDVLNYNSVQVVTANAAGLADVTVEGIHGTPQFLEMILRIYQSIYYPRTDNVNDDGKIKLRDPDDLDNVIYTFDAPIDGTWIRPEFDPKLTIPDE